MCVFMIINKLIWGKYKDETILQLIIQIIYLKVCIYIYRIRSDRTGTLKWDNIVVDRKYIQKVR